MRNVQDSRFPGDCCVLFWDGGLSITADMLPPSLSRWPQKNWLNKYLDNISCCRLPGVGKLISLTDGHSLNFGYIYLAHKQIMLSCNLVVIWSGASWKQKQIYKILTPLCADIVLWCTLQNAVQIGAVLRWRPWRAAQVMMDKGTLEPATGAAVHYGKIWGRMGWLTGGQWTPAAGRGTRDNGD